MLSLGLYGGQDNLITNELVEEMSSDFSESEENSLIVIYPQSGHGFFLPTTEVVTIKRKPSSGGVNYLLGLENMQSWNIC